MESKEQLFVFFFKLLDLYHVLIALILIGLNLEKKFSVHKMWSEDFSCIKFLLFNERRLGITCTVIPQLTIDPANEFFG